MTINDRTPNPAEEPDRIGQLFGEVFDLVEETVARVTDAEVDERLARLLADAGRREPGDLDEPGRMPASNDWGVDSKAPSGPVLTFSASEWDAFVAGIRAGDLDSRFEPASLAEGPTDPARWDEARCALQAAWEQVAIAQAAAAAARREAEVQTATAVAAQQQAAEVTAGFNAYADAALDRAEGILADARQDAARLVAEAERQAEEIVSAARARPVPVEVSPIARSWPWVTSGKSAFLAAVAADHPARPTWQPTGSYRRSVRVRYPTHQQHQLELDLSAKLDEPGRCLPPHYGQPDPGGRLLRATMADGVAKVYRVGDWAVGQLRVGTQLLPIFPAPDVPLPPGTDGIVKAVVETTLYIFDRGSVELWRSQAVRGLEKVQEVSEERLRQLESVVRGLYSERSFASGRRTRGSSCEVWTAGTVEEPFVSCPPIIVLAG